MKYPLTDEAKAEARRLVAAWDEEVLDQTFDVNVTVGGGKQRTIRVTFDAGVHEELRPPEIRIVRQLERYGLVHAVSTNPTQPRFQLEITLLQELRNAVASGFEVSEYFLTMNAVGNIIINSQTGPVQGAGYTVGDVHQSVEQVADILAQALGQEFLETQRDLAEAIATLRSAKGDELKQAASRNVVAQLGRSLGHAGNTAKILSLLISHGPALMDLIGG